MANLLGTWNPINPSGNDGSEYADAALRATAFAGNAFNNAINTIRSNMESSANNEAIKAYNAALAQGMTPDQARASALQNASAFTSASTLNDIMQNARNDIDSRIQQDIEHRTALDWQGENDASAINMQAAEAFRLRDTKAFNEAMARGTKLDPVAQKYLKFEDLVQQNLSDANKKMDLEKGALDMANTRQSMAERAQRMKLEQEALTGSNLIAETRAAMADSGEDPRSSTYGAIFRDTLYKIATAKGIKNPSLYVAKLAPEYLPYITQGNIYDRGVNLQPTAEASTNSAIQDLDNSVQYTDDGNKDTSMAFGMEKGGADLSASRAQAIKLAVKASDMILTEEQEAKLANLAKNPKATAKDFNNFKDEIIKTNITKAATNPPEFQAALKGGLLVSPAGSAGLLTYGPLARFMNQKFNAQLPYMYTPADVGALNNIRFTDTGSGIESTAKTQDAQNNVNKFMVNINAANDAYQTRKQDASLLKRGTALSYALSFNIDPTKLTKFDVTSGKTALNQNSLILTGQKDKILKNYNSNLLKLGKAKSEFNALGTSLDSTLKDYGKSEEALAEQLNYDKDDIPKFRQKYTAAINKAKELGASDASARLAVQTLIDSGKFSSKTLTPDWKDSDLIDAVHLANKVEEQSPGILTKVANINAQLSRNALGIQMLDAVNIGRPESAKKLQQQMQMTYSGENNPVNTGN